MELLKQLEKFEPDWREEVRLVERIYEEAGRPSLRQLATITKKSKSWLGDSLQLVKGLRVYRTLSGASCRSEALDKLQEYRKVRFLV